MRNRRMYFVLVLAAVFLVGCQGNSDKNQASKESSTIETTVVSEMTELENDSFRIKLEILKENVASYKSTGDVLDEEKILATIQEIYTLNLSDSQKAEADEVIQQLPKRFIEYQQAITGVE